MANCSCIHVENCGWDEGGREELEEALKRARDGSKCSDCEKSSEIGDSDAIYMCLKKSCCKLGCSRNSKGHALKHYKTSKSHCLSINVMSLQIWCYECEDYVEGWPLISEIQEHLDGIEIDLDIGTDAVESDNIHYKGIGNVGLYNSGNSCFINAALQVLMHCPTLLGYFSENCSYFVTDRDRSGISPSQPSIADNFKTLVDAINSPERPAAISPIKLIRSASHYNPAFHGYSQQDSMDFLRLILDRLHEELKYQVPKSALLDDDKGNRKVRRKSGRLASKNGSNCDTSDGVEYRSVISETFGGTLRSEVQCHKCNKISIKDDQFFDLSLPLQPSAQTQTSAASRSVVGNLFSSLGESLGLASGKGIKLESAFVNFCLPEVLDGKDRYFCESCKQLVQSTKTLTIRSLPQVLCVQLKRFRHDSYFSSKLNTVVEYPAEGLDLRHFLHKEFIGSPMSSCSEYDLLGIVSHRGSFNGGHYVAYCRDIQTGRWYEFDDSQVREIGQSELLNIQAYLLFYIQKGDPERLKIRIELIKSVAGGVKGFGDTKKFVSKQWYNRLLYSGNPGPIDSFDVACQHGKLRPNLISETKNAAKFLQPIPGNEEFCEALRNAFGELGSGILHEPETCKLCIEETKALNLRRKREDEQIQTLDSTSIGDGEFWYLIDTNWLRQWSAFKNGHQPPPGPISNTRLFKSNTPTVLRENLSQGTHYRGVNERVWNYFYGIYGGGPIIKRPTINIYN